MANIRINITMRDDDLWSRIFGAEPFSFGSWWRSVKYHEGTEWDTPGIVTLSIEDPDDEDKRVKKTLDMNDIVNAVNRLGEIAPHLAQEIVDDNADCVSADAVLQVAVLGDVIYG